MKIQRKFLFPKTQNNAVPRMDVFCRRFLQHKSTLILISVRVRFVVKKATMELVFPEYVIAFSFIFPYSVPQILKITEISVV